MIIKSKSRQRCWEETFERESKWHEWFAWYPVRLDDHHVCWLQTLERRKPIGSYFFMYRIPTKPVDD